MTIRWKIVLPLANILLDCLLAVQWIHYADGMYKRHASSNNSAVRPVLFQEAGAPGWDFRHVPPPGEYLLLESGTFPALVVSGYLRPEARQIWPGHVFDSAWFSIHECAAFALWLLIGYGLDARFLRIPRAVTAFLLIRFMLVLLFEVRGVADNGYKLQTIWWLWFFCYFFFAAVRSVLRRVGVPRDVTAG